MSRTLVYLFIAFISLIGNGCGAYMAKQMIDSVTESQIKLMEAQAKIDKEKRSEKHSVEGEVKSVSMRDLNVPNPDPNNVVVDKKENNNNVKVNVKQGVKTIRCCVVVFVDGREKEFNSIPLVPLNSGSYYKIDYNGMNEIVGVTKLR